LSFKEKGETQTRLEGGTELAEGSLLGTNDGGKFTQKSISREE